MTISSGRSWICQPRKKSGLWAEAIITRHGSGFPYLVWFVQGPELFLLIWYLHISRVASLHVCISAELVFASVHTNSLDSRSSTF